MILYNKQPIPVVNIQLTDHKLISVQKFIYLNGAIIIVIKLPNENSLIPSLLSLNKIPPIEGDSNSYKK
jgi:hypothetical protein